MNRWQNRVVMLTVLAGTLALHAFCLQGKPNTPPGMLGFHTSAALVDLILIRCAPLILSGKLLDDTQILCWLSIAVNLAGWLLYMAYAPPFFYDTAQWALCVIQWVDCLYRMIKMLLILWGVVQFVALLLIGRNWILERKLNERNRTRRRRSGSQ